MEFTFYIVHYFEYHFFHKIFFCIFNLVLNWNHSYRLSFPSGYVGEEQKILSGKRGLLFTENMKIFLKILFLHWILNQENLISDAHCWHKYYSMSSFYKILLDKGEISQICFNTPNQNINHCTVIKDWFQNNVCDPISNQLLEFSEK